MSLQGGIKFIKNTYRNFKRIFNNHTFTFVIISAIDCQNPIIPSNGNVRELTTTFGSTVQFTCDRNYKLEGSATATCQANGRWSYPDGYTTCTGKSMALYVFINIMSSTVNCI